MNASKSLVSLLILFALLFSGWWILFREEPAKPQPEMLQPASTEATQDPLDYAEGDVEPLEDFERSESWDASQASSTTGPGAISAFQFQSDNANEQSDPLMPEYRDQVAGDLEAALSGNVELSIEASLVIQKCWRNYFSESRINSILKNAQKEGALKTGTVMRFSNGITHKIESYDAYAEFLWQVHDQCQSVRDLFTDELRQQIERSAERGQATGRYLFAMWPPQYNWHSPDHTFLQLDYHNRALQYTWANLEEGHPLGLLAMGQSYSGSGRGLFTPTNHSVGRTFLLAAEKCQLQNEWLQSANMEYRNRFASSTQNSLLTNLEKNSDELKNMFCHP